ncbi:MAG: hypothetical protein E7361_00245 [Clostridiales bacterium]|nr:hypothetical protein [Clostridiales bacterium]
MEEVITAKEQLDMSCPVNVAEASVDGSNDEGQSGSLYGKFKDADSLFNGYLALEKEFTKKSQQLSELQKDVVDNTPRVPIYQSENWQSEIDTYLKDKKYADDFAVDIARTIMEDEKLACMPNCLDLAYNKVVANRYKKESDLVQDDDFLSKYIYDNDKIKSKIISDYIKELKSNTTPPIMIKSKGDSVGLISPTKPRNMSEAKEIVERLFNR